MDKPLNNSKGCGGVMRAAPVGLMKNLSPEEAFLIGADSAAITHSHPSGYWSAGAMAMIIRLIIDGADIRAAAVSSIDELRKHHDTEETISPILNALDLAQSEPLAVGAVADKLGEGWVGEEALAVGLYLALVAKDFPDAMRIAASHRGDSDSTATIAGSLTGAYYGVSCISAQWIERVEFSEVIKNMANEVLATQTNSTVQ